jgi:hypothetical protein
MVWIVARCCWNSVTVPAAAAFDGSPALDLPEGSLAAVAEDLRTLDGRLELVACRLADTLDPAPATALAPAAGPGRREK